MNQQVVDAVCASVIAVGRIGPDEVRALRGAIFGDVEVTVAEADQLFRLSEQNLPACAHGRNSLSRRFPITSSSRNIHAAMSARKTPAG